MLLVESVITVPSFAFQDKKTAKTRPAKSVSDTVTVTADALPLAGLQASTFVLHDQIDWSTDIYAGWKLTTLGTLPQCVSAKVDPDQAYVFHIADWSSDSPPQLKSSSWSAFSSSKTHPDILKSKIDRNGNPTIYNKKRVLIIGVNTFSGKNADSLSIKYKTSVTQGTPQNIQNLGQLVTSLLGLSSSVAKASGAEVLIALACQPGTNHLPYTLSAVETIGIPGQQQPTQDNKDDKKKGETNPSSSDAFEYRAAPDNRFRRSLLVRSSYGNLVSSFESDNEFTSADRLVNDAQADKTGGGNANSKKSGGTNNPNATQSPQAGQADCSGLSSSNNCTVTRTFTSLDREWWDISLAQSIPGVRETKYSISNSALQAKPTTHADFYAFFDIDPAGYFFTKNTWLPHLAVGLPVAGQTFYRPFFGGAEDVTGWTHLDKLGFPVHLNAFAGVVYMKTKRVTGNPTTDAELTQDSSTVRVTKPIFGIEVPLSSLISKVGKKSNSNSTNSNGAKGSSAANNGTTASQ